MRRETRILFPLVTKAYEHAARAAAEQRWDELRLSAMCHCPHSLAARIILSRLAPERLPTAGKEIRDLVGLLWKDLRTLLDEIRSLHTWAVLRSDPRASDPSSVDEYLGRLLERERAETRIEIVRLFRECQPQSR